jgi:hypothetical protein
VWGFVFSVSLCEIWRVGSRGQLAVKKTNKKSF